MADQNPRDCIKCIMGFKFSRSVNCDSYNFLGTYFSALAFACVHIVLLQCFPIRGVLCFDLDLWSS